MNTESMPPLFKRLMKYFLEIEDENIRELIAAAVAIKRQTTGPQSVLNSKYRDAVDICAQLRARAEKEGK